MLERLIVLMRLALERTRAMSWSFRGASVESKVRVASGCRVDFPMGLKLGSRVTLESDVWIKLTNGEARAEIGSLSFLGRGVEMDIAKSISVGEETLIAPRVFITDHSHRIDRGESIGQQGCDSDPVTIGNGVWIGAGVTILSGVTIGDGAVVGAGAVLKCSVPPNEIWAGVPAKWVGTR